MKGKFFLTLYVFLLFGMFSIGIARGETETKDVLKEFEDFQSSLSSWMRDMDSMRASFSTLQKQITDSLEPLKEFRGEVRSIQKQLNGIVSRLDVIEKTSSVEGVKDALNSFDKTFDVLKKRVSDMGKLVEDNGVKIAVLEKRYIEAEKPLEPFKRELENFKGTVVKKLEEYEKKVSDVEGRISTRISSFSTMTLNNIAELQNRLAILEGKGKPVVATVTAPSPEEKQGKKEPKHVEETEKGTETVSVEKEEKEVEEKAEAKELVAEEQKVEKKVEKRTPAPEEEGFKEIGEGFFIRKVKLSGFGSSTLVTGEIKNTSDRDYSIAVFTIKIYDSTDVRLYSQDFSIKSFKKGEVKGFSEILTGYSPVEIAKYEFTPKKSY